MMVRRMIYYFDTLRFQGKKFNNSYCLILYKSNQSTSRAMPNSIPVSEQGLKDGFLFLVIHRINHAYSRLGVAAAAPEDLRIVLRFLAMHLAEEKGQHENHFFRPFLRGNSLQKWFNGRNSDGKINISTKRRNPLHLSCALSYYFFQTT